MAFDLSNLTDDELMALSKGDVSKLSTNALYALSGQQPPKRKTTKLEDIGIGLESLAHTGKSALDMLAGAAASYAGDTEGADAIYSDMEKRQARREQEMQQYDQGFGGQLISGATQLVPMMAAAPYVGVLGAAGGMAGMNAIAQGSENMRKGASSGSAIVQAIGEGAIDTATMALPIGRGAIKGALLGVGGNVGGQITADALGHLTMSDTPKALEAYKPSLEKYALAGALGALPGTVFGRMNKHGALEDKPKTDTKDPNASVVPDVDFKAEAQDKLTATQRRLGDAQVRLESLLKSAEGATSPEKKERLQALLNEQAEYVRTLEREQRNLEIALGQTPEAKAKAKAEADRAEATKLETEMEALSAEYKAISSKGAALTKAEKARLTEIQDRYESLLEEAEWNAARLFGEDDPTPTTKQEQPTQEPTATAVPKEEFVPGSNRIEVNDNILSKDVSKHSVDILAKMIENKQRKLEKVSDPAFRELLESEIKHLENAINAKVGKPIDPVYSTGNEKAAQNLQVAVAINDMRAGLSSIANSLTAPWVQRQVAKFMLNNERIGKFIKMHYDSQIKHPAQTEVATGDMTFKIPSEVTPTNYLHEAIHSATSGMLVAFGKGHKFDVKTTNAINNLLNIHGSLTGRLRNQFLNEMTKYHKDAEAAENAVNIVLKNERELLAYAMSDSGVIRALNAISYGGKSYIRTLIDSVADMMGWNKGKERSVLEAIFETGDTLLENSTGRGLLGVNEIDEIRSLTPDGDVGYAFGNKFINTVTNLPNMAMLRMLNIPQIKNFWKNNRLIRETAPIMEMANRRMESLVSLINHGSVKLDQYSKANVLQKLSKMETPDGLLSSLSNVSFTKIGEMVPYFYKADRDGVKLSDNLAKYGVDTWSPEQKHLVKIIEQAVDQMFKAANESLIHRGLPPIKSFGPGYFPRHITGKYYVDITVGGATVRREWFMTQTEAKRLQDSLASNKDITTSIHERQKNADYESIDAVLSDILRRSGPGKAVADTHTFVEAKLQEIRLNQSSVGGHKNHRETVRGFAGDKIGKTLEQNGKDFAHSIESWVSEYANAIRKREIAHDIAKYEAMNPELVAKNPNAHEIMRYVVSNELNELQSIAKGTISDGFNKVANEIFATMFPNKTVTRDVIPYAYSLLTRASYNMVLTSAPTVWLTQTLGFMNAQRMYFKDGTANVLDASTAAAKGLYKVLFKQYDDELLQAMHYVSQNFETLHKHLTNEISEFQFHEDKEHIHNKIYSLVSGETFTSNADAISRMVCFAQAVEYLKSQGKSGESMWIEAARWTDDNMNAFGKKNLAGMYKELGAAGSLISPLKSFIHHQMSTLAIDVKDVVQQRNLGSALALTANLIGLLTMGGLLSAPFLADYEYLRTLLVKYGFIEEDAMFNWTNYAESLDPTLSRGVLSATGVDMGASMRYQSFFKPFGDIVGAESMADLAMPLSVGSKVAQGWGTIVKNAVGDVPSDEVKAALKQALPRGPIYGGIDWLHNQVHPREVTFGKRGQMLVEREADETAARLLGSRSIEEAHAMTKNQQLDQHNKLLTEKKQKAVNLFLSSDQEDKDAAMRIARKLFNNGDWTPEEFVKALQNLHISQHRPALESAVLSNSGTVSKQNLRNYKYLQQMEQK